jgi:hypothetical protein
MARGADSTESLQAYPNIRAAAQILGVSASTLSRRADRSVERRGERDRVLAPAEVLRLGVIFRKRSLNDVAHDLLEHARAASPDEAQRVENEIEAFFEASVVSSDQREQLVTLARRFLPADLCARIETVLEERGADLPEDMQGYTPVPDH